MQPESIYQQPAHSSAQFKDKWKDFRQKYEKYLPAAFFVGGFLFDVATLSQIDDGWQLLQQGAFLFALATLLIVEIYHSQNGEAQEHWKSWQKKIWNYHTEISQFLFGGLLSAFAIHFFLSASLWTSGIFLAFIASLLVINELPAFQSKGLIVRFSLFTLCLFAFNSYLLPILFGQIGALVFLASVAVTAAILLSLLRLGPEVERPQLYKLAGLPSMGILSLLCLLYFFKMIPPVPISIKHLGVYHSVEIEKGNYKLGYKPHFFSFITDGNSNFQAALGERLYVFTSVYSPAHFTDSLKLVWENKNAEGDWVLWDKIPLPISGGRSEGYRGYAYKQNYAPGEWRVLVETSDGREIGRLYFDIERTQSQQEGLNFTYY